MVEGPLTVPDGRTARAYPTILLSLCSFLPRGAFQVNHAELGQSHPLPRCLLTYFEYGPPGYPGAKNAAHFRIQ